MITIIGMPGVGKSTIGKLLADKISYNFIDLDTEIEIKYKKSIPEIFSIYGEKRFRNMETKVLFDIVSKNKDERVILALGGGSLETTLNLEVLEKKVQNIYLNANIETLYRNFIFDTKKRPLAKTRSDLINIKNKRLTQYEKVADISIDINKFDSKLNIVNKILSSYNFGVD